MRPAQNGCGVMFAIRSCSQWSACSLPICLSDCLLACLPVTSLDWNQGDSLQDNTTQMAMGVMNSYEVMSGSSCSGYVSASGGFEGQPVAVG